MNALAHPEWLPALAATCLFVALAVFASGRRGERRRQRFTGQSDPRAARLELGFDLCTLGGMAAIALALLGPLWLTREVPVDPRGVDVVLSFDLSLSMDARDTAPSRLHRAKRAAEQLIDALSAGDRVALTGFAGDGLNFTPLSEDRGAVRSLIAGLSTELAGSGGSSLRAGLEAAQRTLGSDASKLKKALLMENSLNKKRNLLQAMSQLASVSQLQQFVV